MQQCDYCAPVELDLGLCGEVLHQTVTEVLQGREEKVGGNCLQYDKTHQWCTQGGCSVARAPPLADA